ncbi:MAG: ABC transporter substrate-binding protein [Betaproteobacteria bacterium]
MIVAPGYALPALKQVTSTIPVVMAAANDPEAQGYVRSLGHPGGNFTGLSFQSVETTGKLLELLKEIVPGAAPVAAIWRKSGIVNWWAAEAAARERGWKLLSLEIRTVDEIEGVFRAATVARAGAVLVFAAGILFPHAPRVAELAAKSRLPAVYELRRHVEAGGLISYGSDISTVGTGLVWSLARPGGNVTGVVSVIDSLAPKRVELMREILLGARRIGLLGDPTDPRMAIEQEALAPVAKARGLKVFVGEASSPVELDPAVAKLIGQGVEVIVAITSITSNLRTRLMELANQGRLPVVGGIRPLAEAGALFTYGASISDQLRYSAHLVDKVLKGARPADIAVEQPTKFELVVNVRTAKALGLTIPQSVLLRADKVIQ